MQAPQERILPPELVSDSLPPPVPTPSSHSSFMPSLSNGTTFKPPSPSLKEEKPILIREPREKKDSWKKKEAKESTRKPSAFPVDPPNPQTALPTRLRPPPYPQQDFNATPRLPTFTFSHTATLLDRSIDFHRVSDQPFNKKKFRYTPCAATPSMPQIMYRQIELPPYGARVNWQDMNPYIMIDR